MARKQTNNTCVWTVSICAGLRRLQEFLSLHGMMTHDRFFELLFEISTRASVATNVTHTHMHTHAHTRMHKRM